MCASDIDHRRKWVQCAFYYLLTALAVAAFGVIYEAFSHGVYSWYMLYAFAFPLVGGTLPFLSMGLFSERHYPARTCISFYHCGIATLTVGSIVQGILEIYGTTNTLAGYYWPVGGILITVAMVQKRKKCHLLYFMFVALILASASISACQLVKA